MDKHIVNRVSIALTLMLVSGTINAAKITTLNITFGDFNMGSPTVIDGVNEFTGSITMDTVGAVTHIAQPFNFNNIFGPIVDVMTINTGITGNDDNGTVSIDFTNFAANIKGWVVSQTPDANTLILSGDATENTFTVEFASTISDGAFADQIAYWYFEGSYETVVPVPASIWLFSSGLIGLLGLMKHRRKVS